MMAETMAVVALHSAALPLPSMPLRKVGDRRRADRSPALRFVALTPRRTTYDAKSFGVTLPTAVRASFQDRA